jgi:Tol biopolymer transport system component
VPGLRGHGIALALLALAILAGCEPPPAASASEGIVFVRRYGVEKTSPRDLAWARLADGHEEALPSAGTEEMWPYYSSAARLVVFIRGRAGRRRGRLWLWDPSTGEQRPATGIPDRWEAWPDWSPSDPLLSYSALKRGHGGIEVMDLATGQRTLVAPTPSPEDVYVRPSFGPRPDLLVAQRVRRHDSDLFLLHVGRPPEPLLVDETISEEKPVFRRDGGAVLCSRTPNAGGRSQIYEIELASRAGRLLAPDAGADQHTIAVSPTRDEIAFVREQDGRADIWLMPLPNGPARRLTDSPDWDEYAPQWSPDGERIALTGGPAGEPGAAIRVIDRSGAVRFETQGFSPDWMPPPAAAARPR